MTESAAHENRPNKPSFRMVVCEWLLRVIVGLVFIFSGFVKLIDLWGFVYKIQEYLLVWDLDVFRRPIILIAAFCVSALEFTCGVMLALGVMRRLVPRLLLLMMAFMLPLTLYIAIANPVSDCGCFGDAWTLSNTMTFVKNVVITLLLIILVRRNLDASHPFLPSTQWIMVVTTIIYCIAVATYGYAVQPPIDFRPYPVGKPLVNNSDTQILLEYERDGQRRTFDINNLPDSTWTYVGRVRVNNQNSNSFAIFDGDDEVSSEVLSGADPLLILLVSDPMRHGMARSAMANNLNRIIDSEGGEMIAIIAADQDGLDKWISKARPDFSVYTADDTQIKELARGDAALVYISSDTIRWKRNLYSFPGDFPTGLKTLDDIRPVEHSPLLWQMTAAYILALLLIFSLRFITEARAK